MEPGIVLLQPCRVPVRPAFRGPFFRGEPLEARADSLRYHLDQRVVAEQQWSPDTTPDDYRADLALAVRHLSAQLSMYVQRNGAIAAVIAPTLEVVPPSRLEINYEVNIVVVYSADRNMIVSGYQFSDMSKLGIPEQAKWLR